MHSAPGTLALAFSGGLDTSYCVPRLTDAGWAVHTVYVDTGGTRTVPTDLAVLLGRHPSIRLVEGDFGSADFRASMILELKTVRVFAILGPRPQGLDLASLIQGASVERVEVFQRPGGEWAATLFRLRSLP